jgi:hypothetical protein
MYGIMYPMNIYNHDLSNTNKAKAKILLAYTLFSCASMISKIYSNFSFILGFILQFWSLISGLHSTLFVDLHLQSLTHVSLSSGVSENNFNLEKFHTL